MGLTNWFLSLFPLQVVHNEKNEPYIRRYHVLNKKWCPYKIYIHNIIRSDEDRECHDHPWPFLSIILKGWYREYNLNTKTNTMSVKDWRRFSIVRHKAEDAHRLEVEKPMWTLVFIGKKTRDWGFYTDNGWAHNIDYLNTKYGNKHEFMM